MKLIAVLLISIGLWAADNPILTMIDKMDFQKDPVEFIPGYFESREKSIKDGDLKSLRSLAIDYLIAHRIQEAIWTLQRAGLGGEATVLKNKLELFLQTAPVVESRRNWGSSAAKIVTFPGGIKAIVKEKVGDGNNPMNNPQAEVWVYRLSEALGLSLVPTTVFSKNKSIQILVWDSVIGGEDYKWEPYPEEKAALFLLDYLSQNKDRQFDNWLKLPNGRVVAIDHGISYAGGESKDWKNYSGNQSLASTDPIILTENQDTLMAMNISDHALRYKLQGLVPDDVIDFYIKNFQKLKMSCWALDI